MEIKMPARNEISGEFLDGGKLRTARQWEKWIERQDSGRRSPCFRRFRWCAYTYKEHPRYPVPFATLNFGGPVP